MPQMKPMNWMLIMLFTFLIIMLVNINMYYSNNKILNTNHKFLIHNFNNWQW